MTIVQTRYRDIPWGETNCPTVLSAKYAVVWEEKVRGTDVFIETPSHSNAPHGLSKCDTSECTQPKYRVVNRNGVPVISNTGNLVSVCPHIAEIGD